MMTTLYASNTKITDRGMVHLGRIPRLETLDLNSTRAAGNPSTEATEAALLCDTKVTDAGLDFLKPLKTIEFVGLSFRNSPTAVEELKVSLPLFKKNKTG